ncbi:hypothetical protein H4F99_08795 [Lysobacter sp. SG-8]|uniref:Tetratricopeptide repeat protein n=2 Tax=Marilutibacter penaei TaxID=2759900 RepID=A0A7W3U467_9GAMM|nr:hypothetical protein [Lysobacter penaei]
MMVPITMLVAAAFWPGLSGRFIFDDYPTIVSNPGIHIDSLSWEAIQRAAGSFSQGYYGRPLATISLALNYLADGTDPWGYKLTGLCIHVLNTLIVWILLRQLLGIRSEEGENWPKQAAAVIAFIWAVHPLQVSPVLYVVQRMETLSLLFVLLALACYVKARRNQLSDRPSAFWFAACLPLMLLGLASKESAALLPAYTLSLEIAIFRFRASSSASERLLKRTYAVAVSLALGVYLLVVLPHYLTGDSYALRDFSASERLMTQMRVLPMYLGQVLFPRPDQLTFYYDDIIVSTGLLSPPSTALGACLLLSLAFVAFFVRRKAPIVSLGVLWFFAAHAITSNVFPLEHAFEHRNYFALLGALLALADIVRRIPMRDGPALKYVAIGGICTFLFALTLVRSATWGNPLNLAMELANANPRSARASVDLAEKYEMLAGGDPESPFYSLAMTEFHRGAGLASASSLPIQGAIMLAAGQGRPVPEAWWATLESKLSTGTISPQDHYAMSGLLTARARGMALDDEHLAAAYEAMANRSQLPAGMYAMFANHALTRLEDHDLAARLFASAVEAEKDDRHYAERLASALRADGHNQEAQAVEAKAAALRLAD